VLLKSKQQSLKKVFKSVTIALDLSDSEEMYYSIHWTWTSKRAGS